MACFDPSYIQKGREKHDEKDLGYCLGDMHGAYSSIGACTDERRDCAGGVSVLHGESERFGQRL